MAHSQLGVHQDPWSFPTKLLASLLPLACPHAWDLVFLFVELYEALVSPFLQPLEIPLIVIMPTWCISHSSQFSIICKLAEGALCPIIQITDKDVKTYWPSY